MLVFVASFHQSVFVTALALNLLTAIFSDVLPVCDDYRYFNLGVWQRFLGAICTCYDSQQELIDAVVDFQSRINTQPLALSAPLFGALRERMIGQETSRTRRRKTTGFKVDAV